MYSSLEQPAVPISPRVTKLTSITQELTEGRAIDWGQVRRLFDQADFLVAHNAEFERRFLSRIPDLIDGKLLLCTQHLPAWPKTGIASSVRLEDLAAAHGISHIAHRAYGDVIATIQLLGKISQTTGAPYFAEVIKVAARESRTGALA